MKKCLVLFIVGLINMLGLVFISKLLISSLGGYMWFSIYNPIYFLVISLITLMEFVFLFSKVSKLFKPNSLSLENSNQPVVVAETKTKSLFILYLLGHTTLLLGILPLLNFSSQKLENKQLEKQTASQVYDFTKPVLLSGSSFGKNSITIEGNKISWFETVHQSDGKSQKLGNDLFTFIYNPTTSEGVLKQITMSNGYTYMDGTKPYFSNENIYWASRIPNSWDYELKNYNFSKKEVSAVPFTISGELIAEKSDYILDYYSGNIYSVSDKKIVHRITDFNSRSKKRFVFGDDLTVCYVNIKNEIILYDISSDTNKTLFSVSEKNEGDDVGVLGCNSKYVVYGLFGPSTVQEQNKVVYNSTMTMRVFGVLEGKQLVEKIIKTNEGVYNNYLQTEIYGDFVYYSPLQSEKILKLEITTQKTDEVLSKDGLKEWSINSGTAVYQKDSSIYLEKFNP